MEEEWSRFEYWFERCAFVNPGGRRQYFLWDPTHPVVARDPKQVSVYLNVARRLATQPMLELACLTLFGGKRDMPQTYEGLLGYLCFGYLDVETKENVMDRHFVHDGWPACVEDLDAEESARDCLRVALEFTHQLCETVWKTDDIRTQKSNPLVKQAITDYIKLRVELQRESEDARIPPITKITYRTEDCPMSKYSIARMRILHIPSNVPVERSAKDHPERFMPADEVAHRLKDRAESFQFFVRFLRLVYKYTIQL